MKIKMIFIGLAIAIIAFLGIGFYQARELTTIQIVKSVTVKRSKEEVFNMVRYFKNFPKWSPFLAQDPTQKFEVKGNDGEVGAAYHWEGNGGKDLGYQEIKNIDPFKSIKIECTILKPFVANPTFDYSFNELPNGIEVTQIFTLESGIMNAFFMWLLRVKSQMEITNQQGLDLLKKVVEK